MQALLNPPSPTTKQLELIAQLEAEAKDCNERAERSFERCDTDGFLSQWASNITADLNRQKAALLRNGGYAPFPVLCDAEGNVITDRIYEFQDKFAPEWTGRTVKRWKLPDDLAEKAGRRWIPVAGAKASRVQTALGLHEESRWFPADAKLTTGGRQSTGLSGCANAYVAVFRKTRNEAE
jgi:hypothetical protein